MKVSLKRERGSETPPSNDDKSSSAPKIRRLVRAGTDEEKSVESPSTTTGNSSSSQVSQSSKDNNSTIHNRRSSFPLHKKQTITNDKTSPSTASTTLPTGANRRVPFPANQTKLFPPTDKGSSITTSASVQNKDIKTSSASTIEANPIPTPPRIRKFLEARGRTSVCKDEGKNRCVPNTEAKSSPQISNVNKISFNDGDKEKKNPEENISSSPSATQKATKDSPYSIGKNKNGPKSAPGTPGYRINSPSFNTAVSINMPHTSADKLKQHIPPVINLDCDEDNVKSPQLNSAVSTGTHQNTPTHRVKSPSHATATSPIVNELSRVNKLQAPKLDSVTTTGTQPTTPPVSRLKPPPSITSSTTAESRRISLAKGGQISSTRSTPSPVGKRIPISFFDNPPLNKNSTTPVSEPTNSSSTATTNTSTTSVTTSTASSKIRNVSPSPPIKQQISSPIMGTVSTTKTNPNNEEHGKGSLGSTSLNTAISGRTIEASPVKVNTPSTLTSVRKRMSGPLPVSTHNVNKSGDVSVPKPSNSLVSNTTTATTTATNMNKNVNKFTSQPSEKKKLISSTSIRDTSLQSKDNEIIIDRVVINKNASPQVRKRITITAPIREDSPKLSQGKNDAKNKDDDIKGNCATNKNIVLNDDSPKNLSSPSTRIKMNQESPQSSSNQKSIHDKCSPSMIVGTKISSIVNTSTENVLSGAKTSSITRTIDRGGTTSNINARYGPVYSDPSKTGSTNVGKATPPPPEIINKRQSSVTSTTDVSKYKSVNDQYCNVSTGRNIINPNPNNTIGNCNKDVIHGSNPGITVNNSTISSKLILAQTKRTNNNLTTRVKDTIINNVDKKEIINRVKTSSDEVKSAVKSPTKKTTRPRSKQDVSTLPVEALTCSVCSLTSFSTKDDFLEHLESTKHLRIIEAFNDKISSIVTMAKASAKMAFNREINRLQRESKDEKITTKYCTHCQTYHLGSVNDHLKTQEHLLVIEASNISCCGRVIYYKCYGFHLTSNDHLLVQHKKTLVEDKGEENTKVELVPGSAGRKVLKCLVDMQYKYSQKDTYYLANIKRKLPPYDSKSAIGGCFIQLNCMSHCNICSQSSGSSRAIENDVLKKARHEHCKHYSHYSKVIDAALQQDPQKTTNVEALPKQTMEDTKPKVTSVSTEKKVDTKPSNNIVQTQINKRIDSYMPVNKTYSSQQQQQYTRASPYSLHNKVPQKTTNVEAPPKQTMEDTKPKVTPVSTEKKVDTKPSNNTVQTQINKRIDSYMPVQRQQQYTRSSPYSLNNKSAVNMTNQTSLTMNQGTLVREDIWAKSYPSAIMVKIEIPRLDVNPGWRLRGQTVNFTFPCRERVSKLKDRVSILTCVPPTRQKLLYNGMDMMDVNSLAYYNLAPQSVLKLNVF